MRAAPVHAGSGTQLRFQSRPTLWLWVAARNCGGLPVLRMEAGSLGPVLLRSCEYTFTLVVGGQKDSSSTGRRRALDSYAWYPVPRSGLLLDRHTRPSGAF